MAEAEGIVLPLTIQEGDPSDQVSNDAMPRFRIGLGLQNANNKFSASTRCSVDLPSTMPVWGGRADALYALDVSGATSASDYISNSLSFVNGTGVLDTNSADVCASGSVAAWTTPGNRTVNVCAAFKNLSSAMAGTILIHEMLHTLGVSEKPQDPSAPYTTDQITQIVQQYCGN